MRKSAGGRENLERRHGLLGLAGTGPALEALMARVRPLGRETRVLHPAKHRRAAPDSAVLRRTSAPPHVPTPCSAPHPPCSPRGAAGPAPRCAACPRRRCPRAAGRGHVRPASRPAARAAHRGPLGLRVSIRMRPATGGPRQARLEGSAARAALLGPALPPPPAHPSTHQHLQRDQLMALHLRHQRLVLLVRVGGKVCVEDCAHTSEDGATVPHSGPARASPARSMPCSGPC